LWSSGHTIPDADWRTYQDDAGRFYFKSENTSNILSWIDDALTINYSSKYIGMTTNGHADVGSVPSFFAGGDTNDGDNATISFGSDGKIRGSGIYVRDGKEWNIEQSRLFGDGVDGIWEMKRYAGGYSFKPDQDDWYSEAGVMSTSAFTTVDANDGLIQKGGNGSGDEVIFDMVYLDTYNSTSSSYHIALMRDVYLEKLIITRISSYKFKIFTNGYRLFIRDGIYLDDTFTSDSYTVDIHNNGAMATAGGHGGDGTTGSGSQNGANVTSGGAGGTGGDGGGNGEISTLLGGIDGVDAGAGGYGGGWTANSSGNAAGNGADANGGDDAYENTLEAKDGRAGGRGGNGGTASSGSGSYGGYSSGGSGGDSVQAGTKLAHVDPHLLTTFRDIYSASNDINRIAPSAGSGSGSGGGGGGGGYAIVQGGGPPTFHGMSGGKGGGGGGSGGSAGVCMVCVRTVVREDAGVVKIQARGGYGGDGGNGGLRGERNIEN
jgi:hypothetical protein